MDFVNRVAKTLSGADLSPSIPHEPKEQESLYQDYDQMDFGNLLDFGLPLSPKLKGVSSTIKKTHQKVEELAAKVAQKRQQLLYEAQKPINVRLQDKILFTFGIMNIAVTAFILGKWPEHFHWVYSLKFPILMGLRYYVYHQSKWHYFLLDFCYFANLGLLLFLHAIPDSSFLFKLTFAFAAGPLSWAIALWKNSMVFHSLDKITSLFIHLTPSLVVWSLKWFPSKYNAYVEGDSITFEEAIGFPLIVYCFWQLFYYVKVEMIDRHKFKKDPEYMTSYLWLTSDKQNRSLIYKLSNIYGKKYQVWWFGVWQLVYTFLTLLPIKLFYESFWAHTIFLIVMITNSCWNGASFYIEVFSVRYQQSLMECEQHYKKLSSLLDAGVEQKEGKEKSS